MATKRKRSAKRGANPGARKRSTKKGGAKRKGGKRKGSTFRTEVRRFMTQQRKWNRAMESGVNHLYTVTKAAKPKAFSRLPRV